MVLRHVIELGVVPATCAFAAMRYDPLALEEDFQRAGSDPDVDFPMYLRWHAEGKFPLDKLITRRYSIEEAPEAFADLASGRNARGVIVF